MVLRLLPNSPHLFTHLCNVRASLSEELKVKVFTACLALVYLIFSKQRPD